MKNLLLTATLFCACSFSGQAQGYQKSYGRVNDDQNTDQQELYDICNKDLESILVTGTFRNINTFPEIAFYGAVSELNKTGEIQWYKGYLPSDFLPFNSFWITSVLKAENGDIYCFGSYSAEESGYILMKLDEDGEVLFAKKILDGFPDLYPKAVISDNYIYASAGDKVLRMDLNGEMIESRLFEHLHFRNINLDQNGHVILTGSYNGLHPDSEIQMGCPIFTLDQDLEWISGNLYTTDFQTGSFYGHSLIATNSNHIVVGGPGGHYFSANPNGEVSWAKVIPVFSTPIPVDSYNQFEDLQHTPDGKIVGVLNGFFSNDDGIVDPLDSTDSDDYFQYYTALCKIDPATGAVISSKDIKSGHFEGINHIELNNLLIDEGMIYSGGTTSDENSLYHLNYVHKTEIDNLGCGEEARVFTPESWSDDILPVVSYPEEFMAVINLSVEDIDMITVNIPVNYEVQSCADTVLGIDNPFSPDEISMYPNPVDLVLSIHANFQIAQIRVFDILGKEIAVPEISEGRFDFSSLSRGIYIVQIYENGSHFVNQRVLKQ